MTEIIGENSGILSKELRDKELEHIFKKVTMNVIDDYYKNMNKFIAFYSGKFPETDILILISKTITSSALAMFSSFKHYLPNANINYDDLGQTICLNLRKSFNDLIAITNKNDTE